MKEFFSKRWVSITLMVLGTIGIVYIMIYVDVIMRAREAYCEGEKYWSWHFHPEEKRTYLELDLAKEINAVEKKFTRGKIDKTQYEQEIHIAQFNFKEALEESSIKYAYVWYQTAVELFSPPESKWVKLSREKMKEAKEMWKQELKEKNIPFEDYMLE